MSEPSRRKELRKQFDRTPPEAGVFRIVNRRSDRALLGSSANLPGARNRLEFACSSESIPALEHRLHADAREFGFGSFEFEVLDVLDVTPEMTAAEVAVDLATLEALWRERTDPAELY